MSTSSALALDTRRSHVLADAVPGARARDAALVLAGALLTALLAQVAFTIPPSPVPVTGQTLAVGLVGATLGSRRGAAALGLYVLLGLALPFYADGASGWHVVWGPTGGLKIATGQDWGWVVHNGFTIFIVGGLMKAAIGGAVLPSAWALVRRAERKG
jgi:biotin transport system substrate-specific component